MKWQQKKNEIHQLPVLKGRLATPNSRRRIVGTLSESQLRSGVLVYICQIPSLWYRHIFVLLGKSCLIKNVWSLQNFIGWPNCYCQSNLLIFSHSCRPVLLKVCFYPRQKGFLFQKKKKGSGATTHARGKRKIWKVLLTLRTRQNGHMLA